MGSSTSSLWLLLLAGAAGGADAPDAAGAQELAPPPSQIDQRVIGQVVRPGATNMVPVPDVRVTLHRVGSDRAAPLDSTRADRSGRYSFTYRRTGDDQAIYFVSASYGGIAYFTPPLEHVIVRGEEAEIAVFDTTSRHVPISTRGHHVVVSAVDANAVRSITEVYELANDSSVTRVASGEGANDAVWYALLPGGASGFSVTQGDIPGAAVTFRDGRASIFAPIAPGIKQVAFAYSIPASAFPVRVPIDRDTQVLEVLVEEEQGTVSGALLKEVDPVAMERRTFRRFLASDVRANAVAVISLPVVARREIDWRYMVALTLTIGGAMIFALARALRRR